MNSEQAPIGVADVLASKPIAPPLRLMDCCPIFDGAAAFVVSREPTNDGGALRILCAAQASLDINPMMVLDDGRGCIAVDGVVVCN